MNILSIGNSFSQDAQRYLHQIARADGVSISAFNLYIGGCPLSRHYRNMLSEKPAYTLEVNGNSTGFFVSLKEALLNRNWDIITLQQVSGLSGQYETYQPYLNDLAAYVREVRPAADLYFHRTWAYEIDSPHGDFARYDRDQKKMYLQLRAAYDQAAASLGGVRVIPAGDAMQIARSHPIFDYANGGKSLNRDGFHASWTHGRYLIGLTWVEMLTGADLTDNSFIPVKEDQPELTPTAEEIKVLKECAHKAVQARLVKRI